jgi:hypothetical protein
MAASRVAAVFRFAPSISPGASIKAASPILSSSIGAPTPLRHAGRRLGLGFATTVATGPAVPPRPAIDREWLHLGELSPLSPAAVEPVRS